MARPYNIINNYIYFYHLKDEHGNGKFMILPAVPDYVADSLGSTFNFTNILARTAPIATYSYSGPREVQVSLPLHRDMMDQLNLNTSNIKLELGEDYLDTLVNYLQAAALPSYAATSKMIDPPMVAVRFGDDLFIKGVVNGGVTTSKKLPLLADGRYAHVDVSFTVTEVDPYDAQAVIEQGMMRGLSTTLERSLYKQVGA